MADTRTVYVKLMNEPADAWRPVIARHVADHVYELPQTRPDPGEVWEFPPGSTVRCETRRLSDGPVLVAAAPAPGISPLPPQVPVPAERIAEFCRRWRITEFALFGSVLRDDFGPGSDVDVLVTFDDEAQWSLMDLAAMKIGLEELFNRPVDLVEKRGLVNPFRRHNILTSKRVVYAA